MPDSEPESAVTFAPPETFFRPSSATEIRLKGIPASPGIAIAKAVVLHAESPISATEKLPDSAIPDELHRFSQALGNSRNELNTTIALAREEAAHVAAILETYLLILTDEILSHSIRQRIMNGNNAENAVMQEFETQLHFFKGAKDQVLRERGMELEHVKHLLLSSLRNKSLSHSVAQNSVIISPSITPSDLLLFNEYDIASLVTEVGGIASHSSILARSFNVPAVIGIKDATRLIPDGSTIIVDGFAGVLIVNPRERTLAKYEKRKIEVEEHRRRIGRLAKLPSETKDKRKIHLHANVDSIEDVDSAMILCAEGIGLARTEYLILRLNRFPSEEEQYAWYSEIAERAYPHPVTLRAFDIGNDKYIDGFVSEENPALGLRGIRVLLRRRDIFITQLRAILRASCYKNIRLMLPMITRVSEVIETLKLIDEIKLQLRRDEIPFDQNMPVGVMIETPAAALMAGELVPFVSFFSIGTNDLTQYTLAADRSSEYVADIYDSFHPAVLKLIKYTIEAAKRKNIPVGVCGELAGHAAATELLLGLGVSELSVSPPMMLELKKRIRKTNCEQAVKLARAVLRYSSTSDVRKKISTYKKT